MTVTLTAEQIKQNIIYSQTKRDVTPIEDQIERYKQRIATLNKLNERAVNKINKLTKSIENTSREGKEYLKGQGNEKPTLEDIIESYVNGPKSYHADKADVLRDLDNQLSSWWDKKEANDEDIEGIQIKIDELYDEIQALKEKFSDINVSYVKNGFYGRFRKITHKGSEKEDERGKFIPEAVDCEDTIFLKVEKEEKKQLELVDRSDMKVGGVDTETKPKEKIDKKKKHRIPQTSLRPERYKYNWSPVEESTEKKYKNRIQHGSYPHMFILTKENNKEAKIPSKIKKQLDNVKEIKQD